MKFFSCLLLILALSLFRSLEIKANTHQTINVEHISLTDNSFNNDGLNDKNASIWTISALTFLVFGGLAIVFINDIFGINDNLLFALYVIIEILLLYIAFGAPYVT